MDSKTDRQLLEEILLSQKELKQKLDNLTERVLDALLNEWIQAKAQSGQNSIEDLLKKARKSGS